MCQHCTVARAALLVALVALLGLPVLVAACSGSSPGPVSVPPPAPPQEAELGWVESTAASGDRFVFRVERFAVTPTGWSAHVTVTNATTAAFDVGTADEPLSRAFGVMVFRTGALDELKRRDLERDLPDLRRAATFDPALPDALAPGATWSGTISASGALPAGLWVRVVFGAFVPSGKMPDALREQGVVDQLTWITDHAYRLRAD